MKKTILRVALVSVAALSVGSPALAEHSWGTYHWSKGTNQLGVTVGDNVDSRWDQYLVVALGVDASGNPFEGAKPSWNDSSVIASPLVAGATDPKRCKAAAGKIEVCNARYGRTGWLGVAGISISGGHIVSGYTKVNDTYFDTAKYNTPGWRRLVMCQEIGHDYGLGHTDETFANTNHGTCMDYTDDPDGTIKNQLSNEYQNAHDFVQLETIYGHSHQATTNFGERKLGAAPAAAEAALEGGNSPADWGRAVAYDGKGRPHIFEKNEGGRKIITHVFWTLEHKGGGSQDH
ncbi:hypothetical protein [Sphingomonas sp.]|uniref:hypothetical protein n=1 Tax=Sphingomonas sp. TaxID=28214 RepID=UPI00182063A6|nr:hypothetical protein [Sphingomonas sp.]MBA3512737.1 hypothetical protein [Sphingomonas sp.]